MAKFWTTGRFRRATAKFSVKLRHAGLPHALVGGNAVDYWANPPRTKDIDIAVASSYGRLLAFVEAMRRQHPEVVLAHTKEPTAGTLVLYYVDHRERVRVDVIMSDHPVFEWSLRESFRSDELPLPVARPENLVLSKFIAGRPKDARAIRAILRGNVRQAVNWKLVARRLSFMGLLRRFNRTFGTRLRA